jgi:hypothetical protein
MSRSAGGHIHIGKNTPTGTKADKIFKKTPERLVNMLDIIVGNTCVLLDRSEGNKKRRETYGRAGEYRLPTHGLEYRTLSNFWLKDYALMSFVMSMTRLAVSIVVTSTPKNNIEKEILSKIKIKDITKAINENNFALAQENFSKIQKILTEITQPTKDKYGRKIQYENSPITENTLELFNHFTKKGIDYWFKGNIIKNWIEYRSNKKIQMGRESFLKTVVKEDKLKETIN